jgi:hypothetical protein
VTQDPPSNDPVSPTPPQPAGPGPDTWGPGWDRRGRRHHCRHHHHHHGGGVILGLLVIAWGGLLLAREYGLVDPGLHVLAFWPLVLVGLGLGAVLRMRSLGSVVFGLAVAGFGGALLAERLGYAVGGAGRLWPLLVVAAGLGLVLKGLRRRRVVNPAANETVSADELQRSVTMGGLSLVVDSQRFKGGTLNASMSGVQLDLRRAALAGDEARLDVSLFMSGLELYVPPSWRIVDEVTPFMGAVEDKTEHRPDGSGAQPRLVLRGSLTMGAVTVKN